MALFDMKMLYLLFVLLVFHNKVEGQENSCVGMYTECCTFRETSNGCHGSSPGTCLCDAICQAFDDCCSDQDQICSEADNPYSNSNTTYLIYGSNRFISIESFDQETRRLIEVPSGGAFAVDVDTVRNYVYWSDNVENTISRASLDTGDDIVVVANISLDAAVGDIAVDWVANRLYWTETKYRRLVAMDLNTGIMTTVLRSSPLEVYKAIAVDSARGMMFWSVWEDPASIWSGSMDGLNGRTLHTELYQPTSLTADIEAQKIYWTAGKMGKIESSDYNGNNRIILYENPNSYFFGIAQDDYLLFFGDWRNNTVSYTHKLDEESPVLVIKSNLTARANGMEVVYPGKQPPASTNPCDNNPCEGVCLLSNVAATNYSCHCSDGLRLMGDGMGCEVDPQTIPPPSEETCNGTFGFSTCCSVNVCGSSCYCDTNCRLRGDCCVDIDITCPRLGSSCSEAGYTTCCEEGGCQGQSYSPGNCFCDDQCREFGNCCDDIEDTCPTAPVTMAPRPNELPFLQLNVSEGVETQAVGHFDDGASHAINLPNGFPFDGTVHSTLYIGTNGILSFDQPVYSALPSLFPSTRNEIRNIFIVAPFWDDVDLRRSGDILYEVHNSISGNAASINMLSTVNSYVSEEIGEDFEGNWMLVVKWDMVHPWPHGDPTINPIFLFIFPDYNEMNTWQAIIITDGIKSYTIFTYQCGSLSWSRGTVIGYNAAGRDFMNHPLSGGTNVASIACSNAPLSNWTNVFYDITGVTVNITEPPTVEPVQQTYLAKLPFLNINNSSGTLPSCQNCSSGPISLGSPGIPFGYYYHDVVYVGVNGIISFDREFNADSSQNFPSMNGSVYYSYLASPYWSNIDTRRSGQVRYESYTLGDSSESDDQLEMVDDFINIEQDPGFQGEWMLLVSWEDVHPYPHGDVAEAERIDPYLDSTNTFQAIIISNYTKTYAIYTYYCDEMEWSDEAAVGFNAAGDFYMNHPLGGQLQANSIGCVHLFDGVDFNNVIYDLVPTTSSNLTTPPTPPRFLGSCVQQGFTDCCESGDCLGSPADCMCDEFCHLANDCCPDIESTCNRNTPPNNDTFLIFANLPYINRINVDGSFFHIISEYNDKAILGIDYDYRRDKIYWSEAIDDQILRSNFDGSSVEVLANATHEDIEDIAVDWVGNNLYWTESVTGNIEVLDLDTFERAVILNTGAHSIPRGIAVDPVTRMIFWTDWGDPAKIESASMDGTNRRVIHSTGLAWPNGITLDYTEQRIYWVDALLDRIEYSSYNGSNRIVLMSGLLHPFAITLEGSLVFWTDWAQDSIFSAHKERALGVRTVREFLRERPFGIESVSPTRQADTLNPCLSSTCSHICLLSSTDPLGYSCVCPRGFELQPNQIDCVDVGTTRPPPVIGSCTAAGYSQCCSVLLSPIFCAGSAPYNCYCDSDCVLRGDCCPDIANSCPMSNGSCVDAGYQACCSLSHSTCRGSDELCNCDYSCSFFGDCCSDYSDVCPGGFQGSCANAGYSTCCESGDCFGISPNCKCDFACRTRGDCCIDIDDTCSSLPSTSPPPTDTVTTEDITTMEMTTPTATTMPTEMTTPPPPQVWLPFLNLTTSVGIQTFYLQRFDDGSSAPISIPNFFQFGSSLQATAYVNTNGIISFGQPFTLHTPSPFPSTSSIVQNAYLLAPFWSDVDIRQEGEVLYEIHTSSSGNDGSDLIFSQVNSFLSNYTGSDFAGVWMLVAEWKGVHPYPGTRTLSNTFQAIAITDDTRSYTIFTYKCGLMEWSGSATIGYNDYRHNFYTHPLSGSDDAQTIACANSGLTPWSNVVLDVTATILPSMSPSAPPPLGVSLPFLEPTGINMGVLDPCDLCTSGPINITSKLFPFGNYYHRSVQVNSKGVISFSADFPYRLPSRFPSSTAAAFSFAVAPFWSDTDTRSEGIISYEVHYAGDNPTSDGLLQTVSRFINSTGEEGASDFVGTWMLVATWDGVPEFRGGDNVSSIFNTFQAITITDGTNSYAVLTYRCDQIEWSGSATIGFNAAGDFYDNYILSGTPGIVDVDCSNNDTSVFTNIVYNLVPDGRPGSDPPPVPPYGSCADAGFSACCGSNSSMGGCSGSFPYDCFCDKACEIIGDCCDDYQQTCPPSPPSGNDSYILVANTQTVGRLNLLDTSFEVLYGPVSGTANIVGLDYDYTRGFIYFSDTTSKLIRRMNLDGSNPTDLINVGDDIVGDLALDWISNNLYWTDSRLRRIVVMDLDTMARKVLVQLEEEDSVPRAIAVDPGNRYIYWTEWGTPSEIERRSMDGGRTSSDHLHDTGLQRPSGITIDYTTQRVFWVDVFNGRVESSNVDGSNRQEIVPAGGSMVLPFSLTLDGRVLYWTDWSSFSIYGTHGVPGDNVVVVYDGFGNLRPNSLEAVSPYRQYTVPNPCEGNSCSHLCLLSVASPNGFTCACPDYAILMSDGLTCDVSGGTPTPTTPPDGTCLAAGYTSCCTSGVCNGSPPVCFCGSLCSFYGDCCRDQEALCSPISSSSALPPSPTLMLSSSTSTSSVLPTSPSTTPQATSSTTPPIQPTSTISVPTTSSTPKASTKPSVTSTNPPPVTSTQTTMPMITSTTTKPPPVTSTQVTTMPTTTTTKPPPVTSTQVTTMPTTTTTKPPPVTSTQVTTMPTTTTTKPPPVTSTQTTVPTTTTTTNPPPMTSTQTTVPTTTTTKPPPMTSTQTTMPTTTSTTKPPPVTSTVTTPVTTPPPTISPDPVTNLKVMVNSDTSLLVSWMGTNVGGIVYSLQITNYTGDVASTNIVASSNSDGINYSVSVSRNIGPYIPYNVSVFGSIGASQGPSRSVYYVFTKEAVPPVAPSGIEYNREKDTLISVKWNPLTPDKALGRVLNYTISYRISDKKRDAETILEVTGAEERQAVIDGLDAGTGYMMSMWANTSAGKGKESTSVLVEVLNTSPSNQSSPVGPIVGGIIGAIIVISFIAVVVLLSLYLIKRKNKEANTNYELFGNENNDSESSKKDEDQEEVLTILFKQSDAPISYDNPLYDKVKGRGLPPGSSGMDEEILKEDLGEDLTFGNFEDDVVEL